jgi:hypothetical protein
MIAVKLRVDFPYARDAISLDLYSDGQQIIQSASSPELRRHRLNGDLMVSHCTVPFAQLKT